MSNITRFLFYLLYLGIMVAISIGIIPTANKSGQVVEKGEYSRIQYITEGGVMTPEFIEGYYYVLRDGDTGKEDRVEISEEEFESYVVGDLIERR